MSEKGEKIMKTFGNMIPKMNEKEQERLLAFAEGMSTMKDMHDKKNRKKKGA